MLEGTSQCLTPMQNSHCDHRNFGSGLPTKMFKLYIKTCCRFFDALRKRGLFPGLDLSLMTSRVGISSAYV